MPQRTLNRESLTSKVTARLERMIQEGAYPTASVLPSVQKLCELFGVSRTVVREALRDLSARGFVEIVNGRGAVVQEINTEMLRSFFRRVLGSDTSTRRDLMEIRRLLEVYGATRAATLRTDDDVACLRTILSTMEREIVHPERYAAADLEFHMTVARIAANEFLVLLIGSIRTALRDTMERSLYRVDRSELRRIHRLHEEIADSIEKGDPPRARRSMHAHFDDILSRSPETNRY